MISSFFQKEIEDNEKYIKQYSRKYYWSSLISKLQRVISTILPTIFMGLWLGNVSIPNNLVVIELAFNVGTGLCGSIFSFLVDKFNSTYTRYKEINTAALTSYNLFRDKFSAAINDQYISDDEYRDLQKVQGDYTESKRLINAKYEQSQQDLQTKFVSNVKETVVTISEDEKKQLIQQGFQAGVQQAQSALQGVTVTPASGAT